MAMRTSKKGRKRAKELKGLVPLSAEEIRTRIEEKRNPKEAPPPMVLDQKRVTIIQEPDIDWPELWLNVYVHGPEAGPSFNKMFSRAKCFKSDTPDDADLVVFSGSSHDVNPTLYGTKPHRSVSSNDAIDKNNLSLFAFCAERGIPMLGVCGGAQILHVAMGGALFQDVDGHNSSHTMWCIDEKMMIDRVSSIHHQMCIRQEGMTVLAHSHTSRVRVVDPRVTETGANSDIEAFFYRDRCILGFQGHPEYTGYPKYTEWCLKQVDHCLNENPDLGYRANDTGSNKLRIKPEIMAEIEAKKTEIITTTVPSEDMIIVEQTTKG